MSSSLDLQKSLPEKQSFHLEMHLNMKPHKNKDTYYQLAFRCLEVVHPTSVSVLGGQLICCQGCQLDRKMASAPFHWPGWSTVHPCHRERKGGSSVFNCCCHSDSEGINQPRVNLWSVSTPSSTLESWLRGLKEKPSGAISLATGLYMLGGRWCQFILLFSLLYHI